LKDVETSAIAVLAETEITLRDFLNINVGDVLITDTRSIEPSRVLIAGLGKFLARPGARGKHRAVEILTASTD
jgi:flagellar motor switch protein FliM